MWCGSIGLHGLHDHFSDLICNILQKDPQLSTLLNRQLRIDIPEEISLSVQQSHVRLIQVLELGLDFIGGTLTIQSLCQKYLRIGPPCRPHLLLPDVGLQQGDCSQSLIVTQANSFRKVVEIERLDKLGRALLIPGQRRKLGCRALLCIPAGRLGRGSGSGLLSAGCPGKRSGLYDCDEAKISKPFH